MFPIVSSFARIEGTSHFGLGGILFVATVLLAIWLLTKGIAKRRGERSHSIHNPYSPRSERYSREWDERHPGQ